MFYITSDISRRENQSTDFVVNTFSESGALYILFTMVPTDPERPHIWRFAFCVIKAKIQTYGHTRGCC